MPPTGAGPDGRPASFMFSALQTTHQHADAKAGILAGAQAVLVGTAGAWSHQALHAWERGGAVGATAGTLLTLFMCGLFGGVGCLVAALQPRVLRPTSTNRYSFVHLASGPDILPAEGAHETSDRLELSQAIRFLARVAVLKYRCLTGAVACTALMAVSAGLSVVLRPVLT
ncbi:Pycsar system effector family protein [Streptomyces sp. E11-3]|uniref:Pycsar system effector family protein n=1 Tax=Streptomyces sp. E11-3 TaxID=3110112 RepID=UPI00398004E2